MLARAVVLAERGRGTTRPNPVVGCVIAQRDRIVGEGWHVRAGGPHAEVVALQAAGGAAIGATAFVSIEPCDHHGRTPPCSVALTQAGVARVVYALADPNSTAAGGAVRLRRAGVDVVQGGFSEVVARQNEEFVTLARTGRPHVTLKLAQTRAGGLVHPARRWITGPQARHRVHELRASVDAVLVGAGTVRTDGPRLDARDVEVPLGQPRPVILAGSSEVPVDVPCVRPGTIVLAAPDSPAGWRRAMEARGAVCRVIPPAEGGIDLFTALTTLLDLGVATVLAEPGARLATAMVSAGLVDRLVLHISPEPEGPEGLATPVTVSRWQVERVRLLGDDVEVLGRPVAAD